MPNLTDDVLDFEFVSTAEPEQPFDTWEPLWCACGDCMNAIRRRREGLDPSYWRNRRTGRLLRPVDLPEGAVLESVPDYEPPPPTVILIPDAEGNMHELREGILAMSRSSSGNSGFAGRVVRIGRYGDRPEDVEVALRFTSDNWSYYASNLLFLSDAPPVEGKEPPLNERRNRLESNLTRAVDRVGRGSEVGAYNALHKLWALVSQGRQDQHWFWRTLAESLDDPRKVSFAPEPALVDNDQRRRFCSVKKLMQWANTKGFSDFTDDEIRLVSEAVGNHFPSDYNYQFEVVEGQGVVQAYCDGEHWGSCMHRRSRYVAFYGETPEKCKLVKIMQGGNYIGRALMWHTDQGGVVVDRVYPSDNGPHTTALHAWCEENGYDYKTRQSCTEGSLKSERWDYTITMNPSPNGSYPYIDTFKFTNDDPEDSDSITLAMRDGEYVFCQTGGGYDGARPQCTCYECGCRVDEDECEWHDDNPYCDSCYDGTFVCLDYTLGGRWVEGTYYRDDVCRCSHCDEWRRLSHTSELANGDAICHVCIEEGEANNCESCGDLLLTENLTRSDEEDGGDGEYRCADCHADHLKEREEAEAEEAEAEEAEAEEAEAEEEQEEEGAITAPAEPARIHPLVLVLAMAEWRQREGLQPDWPGVLPVVLRLSYCQVSGRGRAC